MPAVMPFWVVQRQVRSEPVGEDTVRLTAPNLPAHELSVRAAPDQAGWIAMLHRAADGSEAKTLLAETSESFPNKEAAWDAAYELYRQYVIV